MENYLKHILPRNVHKGGGFTVVGDCWEKVQHLKKLN